METISNREMKVEAEEGRAASPAAPATVDRRSFWGLIGAQFFGAFNDNFFKQALLLSVLSDRDTSFESKVQVTIAGTVVFILPFVLFSPLAGTIGDRFSKRRVTVGVKLAEIVLMVLGTVGFLLGNVPFLIGVLFLMSLQSAIFSPSKYGMLPELLPERELPRANGFLEMTTFLAILLGTLICSVSFGAIRDHLWLVGLGLVALATIGLAGALFIRRIAAVKPDCRLAFNPIPEIATCVGGILKDRGLRLAASGISYFWGLGVVLPLVLMFYAFSEYGEMDEELNTGLLLGATTIGIGLGSFLAGIVSRQKPELGLVPIGSFGMGLFAFLLWFSELGLWWGVGCVLLLGIAGGFFLVPLNVFVQQEAPEDGTGRVIAGVNLLANIGMLIALGALWALMNPIGLTAPYVFFVMGLLTILATLFVFSVVPGAFFRFVFWLVTNVVYKINVVGRENLPTHGPALLVANHVSYVDGNLVLASTHRHIRFVVYRGFTQLPGLRHLARSMRVIPIAPEDGPRELVKSLKEASAALQAGELVCIFAEGQISRTGQLLPFRSGVEKILKGVDAPVIPVYLDRVWGSIFSFEGGRFFWKWPKRIPYPVSIRFGAPLPASTPVARIRQAVQELGSDAFLDRKELQQPLHVNFIRECRANRFKLAVVDSTGAKLSRIKLLISTIALARRMRRELEDQERVGLLAPPSVGGTVANLAATLLGKPVVNFNYTAGAEAIRSAARQCGITKVITSKKFLENYTVEVPGEAIYLEDLRGSISGLDRAVAALAAWTFPTSVILGFVGSRDVGMDDVATVIFSSGSTGEPKGVELTHFNILSNVQGLSQVYTFTPSDRILGVLPFFHSTGYMGVLWVPALTGMAAVCHPNPLDARVVGYLARTYGATFMIATPTFLQGYTRRCEPGDFGSLRYIVVGAEKLTDAVRESFAEKFGVEPLEGYGTTECSPLVSVNVPDFRGRGVRQVGRKRGIGHPLPGVSVCVVDPDSHEPKELGQEGLLLVKGPNIMRGYLGQPELTAKAMRNGWYVTGDIAKLDDDGFITLTDRLARFAKISGEMVPNVKVETALHEIIDATEQRLVVTAIPDAKKGERLAVVHTLDDSELERVHAGLADSKLPNLWVPRKDAFVKVDAIPVLGTGKVDLRRVKEVALEALGKDD